MLLLSKLYFLNSLSLLYFPVPRQKHTASWGSGPTRGGAVGRRSRGRVWAWCLQSLFGGLADRMVGACTVWGNCGPGKNKRLPFPTWVTQMISRLISSFKCIQISSWPPAESGPVIQFVNSEEVPLCAGPLTEDRVINIFQSIYPYNIYWVPGMCSNEQTEKLPWFLLSLYSSNRDKGISPLLPSGAGHPGRLPSKAPCLPGQVV